MIWVSKLRKTQKPVPRLEPIQTHSLRKLLILPPSSFDNIDIICSHFLGYAQGCQDANEIMGLIKLHFKALELRRVDGLTLIPKYHENPSQVQFFRLFVRHLNHEWTLDMESR